MTELAALLLIGAVAHGLAKWLRLPVIPLLLGLGILWSMSGGMALLPATTDHAADIVTSVAELGLAFLVFTAGIELNPQRIRDQRRIVLWVGFGQFAAAGLLGWLAARWLGFSHLESAYLAFALSASSTLVVLRHLQRQRQMFEPFGRLVLGVLLLQDLLMILLIVTLAHGDESWSRMLGGVAAAGLLAIVSLLLQKVVFPRLIRRAQPDEEVMLLLVLALLFGFAGAAFNLDLPPVVGAFFAGFALSSFPVSGLVRGLLNSLDGFFQAIFFAALGVLVHPPDWNTFLVAAGLSVLVLIVTPLLVAVMCEWAGMTSRAALESGLLLAQASEFSLVIGLSGLYLGHIDDRLFSVIAMVTAITMGLTPFLATDTVIDRLLALHPLRRKIRPVDPPQGHVLILGFGSAGMWTMKPLQAAGYLVLVVDDDPAMIEQLRRAGIPCLRGDGADERVLDQAGAGRARLVIASMKRVEEAEKVLDHLRNVPVVARVFEVADAERIKARGGIPVLNSQASAEAFMAWFNGHDWSGDSSILPSEQTSAGA